MNFLELTSYLSDTEGYAAEPDFTDDIWPLIRRRAREIEGVYLFRNDGSSVGWLGYYEMISENIARINALHQLTDDELDRLQHWSFYGGHLNVLYRLSTESPLLRELCKLFPRIELSSDDINGLGLGPASLAELRAFTAALPSGSVHFAFSHDADPLFIFGELEVLRTLLQTYYESASGG